MPNYINFFKNIANPDTFFWFCTLLGSGMFFIQFIISLFSGTDPDGLDAFESPSSENPSVAETDTSDAKKFKRLSLQTITGFLMMFGWTAITCQKEFGLQIATTIAISLAVGIFTALIIRSIFKMAKNLRSSGSIYRIEDAIGKEAYVYQSIPKGGKGKISISLQNFTHEIDAISHFDEELPSFTPVKITEISDENTVLVTPL